MKADSFTDKFIQKQAVIRHGTDVYQIDKLINAGSFGVVFAAHKTDDTNKDLPIGTKVAIKKEQRYVKKRGAKEETLNELLLSEYNFYTKQFVGNKNVPAVYAYCYQTVFKKDWNFLVMQLCGENLVEVFKKHNNAFSVGCVKKIAYRVIEIMESVHEERIVYRDIKPDNFMLTGNKYEPPYIVIADFGLSTSYMKNDQHLRDVMIGSTTGTSRYMSISAHKKRQHSRKSDLESVGYMFAFFAWRAKLPWQGLNIAHGEDRNETTAAKKAQNQHTLFTHVGGVASPDWAFLQQYQDYVCDVLEFAERPDYDMLRRVVLDHDAFDALDFDWLPKSTATVFTRASSSENNTQNLGSSRVAHNTVASKMTKNTSRFSLKRVLGFKKKKNKENVEGYANDETGDPKNKQIIDTNNNNVDTNNNNKNNATTDQERVLRSTNGATMRQSEKRSNKYRGCA